MQVQIVFISSALLQQVHGSVLNSSEDLPVEGEEDMIDVESLLDDDNFMAIAFE